MSREYDAIIIGGGPAGSTAAILLAQTGWSVALVEKQAFPRRKVCGECVAAPNLALLEKLGLADDIEHLAGEALRQVVLMSGETTVTADLPPLTGHRFAWGRALAREHLDTLLLARAAEAGAEVMQPWTVKAVHGSLGRYACEIFSAAGRSESQVLVAPVVIAACGSWERQAFLPQPDARHKPGDLFAFKASFRNAQLRNGSLPVLAFAGGYGGMVQGGAGVLTLACCIRRDTLKSCRQRFPAPTAAASVEAYLRTSCAGVDLALAHAECEGAWLSVGPLQPGIRLRKASHDFFLVGNAAAEAHPIIGEGISMAMQSAWLLCDKLLAGSKNISAPEWRRVRQAYIRDWHTHFAMRVRLAALFAHLAMRPRLRRAVLPLLQRWPGMLTRGARLSGKVRPLTNRLQGEMS